MSTLGAGDGDSLEDGQGAALEDGQAGSDVTATPEPIAPASTGSLAASVAISTPAPPPSPPSAPKSSPSSSASASVVSIPAAHVVAPQATAQTQGAPTMAAAIFLVSKSNAEKGVVNNVTAALVNKDSATAPAAVIAVAVAKLNSVEGTDTADGAPKAFDADYFDTVVNIGATPAGALAADGAVIYFDEDGPNS